MWVFYFNRIAMFRLLFLSLSFLVFCTPIYLFPQDVPFSKGVNLTGWFQAGSARQIHFAKYTKEDLEQIKSLGCDAIRLPINLHFMTDGAPNYSIDPLFFNFLDQVVDWAEELEIHLILDNHTFSPSADTDPNIGPILEKVWVQMAEHYKDRSNFLYYEVLNEPHGISDLDWNNIQQKVIEAIRTVDTKHTIVIGPANWNSFHNLDDMPVYEDDNLIYTFHFYDPFIFTHQGASWTSPSMEPLGNVPFPYQADQMPAFPQSLAGTWIQFAFAAYALEGHVSRVKELIDIAAQFKESRNVPVYCGEFGVHIPKSDNAQRVFWYETVRKYLEEKNIPWTIWDYHGGFGLYEGGSNGLFNHDLNVPLLEALGMNIPDQTPYIPSPDSTGFVIYDDAIGKFINESSYGEGTIDFYATDGPALGEFCISWTGAARYNVIGFEFRPVKDLSYLVTEGYGLDLRVRGNRPAGAFDIRFMDTKISETDRPWRMRTVVDENDVDWDGEWHHLHIPLSEFEEHGAWDNAWYPPEGKFDWAAIDRLEIVTENHPLENNKLWVDQIVVDLDTSGTTNIAYSHEKYRFSVFPNPVTETIHLQTDFPQPAKYELLDGLGRVVKTGTFVQKKALDLSTLPSSYYIMRISNGNELLDLRKIFKY